MRCCARLTLVFSRNARPTTRAVTASSPDSAQAQWPTFLLVSMRCLLSATVELASMLRRHRALVLMAEDDATLGQIVRRHLQHHAVAGDDADTVLFHAARYVG